MLIITIIRRTICAFPLFLRMSSYRRLAKMVRDAYTYCVY
ncbi:hypothetical protein BSAE_1906 [Bifidobacterium pullorum subsp. saeculare DSM 6531 = LMG 14934]|uniref:Uncharacterized protein n=1 Tax=Bifidobacterium pullorum subsp. saeculare DSM 6531 = LMG 14934 TaxID=1437611 RepID=A0A087CPX8_9BIFI|nr:hypothetical protein BSAE_1906 [Bifidobacterium pullorum subsp. saeculare DSM 6531 = LMG 14934]